MVSTHDLELALRTADVVWLVLPGGELVTGAPEDVMLSGGIAHAFEGRQIRFHAEERSFRWFTGERGTAAVRGDGLPCRDGPGGARTRGFRARDEPATAETIVDSRCSRRGLAPVGRLHRRQRRHLQSARQHVRGLRATTMRRADYEKHQHDAGRRRRNQPRRRRARVEGVGAGRDLRHRSTS